MREINGYTDVYAVIGDPAKHSLSPAMHNAAFEHLGINAVYVAHNVDPSQVSTALKGMQAIGYRGLNVTMPHKNAVYQLMDEPSPAATLMEAVNTVRFDENGRMYGTNTDGSGTFEAIEAAGYKAGNTIKILGAGGASSAMYVQAALDGVKDIAIFSRPGANYDATEKRIRTVNDATGANITIHSLEDKEKLASRIAESSCILDATSVGMAPNTSMCLVEEEWLNPGQVVFDAVYYPAKTELMLRATRAGAGTVNGLSMLLWQGVHAQQLWLERNDIPVNEMKKVLEAKAYPKPQPLS